MRSASYREIIRRIANGAIKRHFPNGNKRAMNDAAKEIAVNIHARMYGANVDGVESPIWRDKEPDVTADEILNTPFQEKENQNGQPRAKAVVC